MRIVVLALLLAGCAATAQPHDSDPIPVPKLTFANYHELVRQTTLAQSAPNIPADVAGIYAQCWADAKVARMSPDDLADMDRVARGERQITTGELRRSDEAIYRKAGTSDPLEFMAPYCPGSIAQFKIYQ